MANQRKSTKRLVSGYLDTRLKSKIQETEREETQFVEICVIRGLIDAGKLTKSELRALVQEGQINLATIKDITKFKLL